jgi:hypothetical protein
MNEMPWKLNSDLAKERLITIASIIAKKRGEVIDLHDELLGDTPRALGMRCYECCRTAIIRASSDLPWLHILTHEGRFTYRIGNTPARFSRNDPEDLPNKKLITSFEAEKQMDWLNETYPYAMIRWFIVFDTHFKSPADAVYCVGYTKTNEIICQWQIPLEDKVTLISEVNSPLPQAVDIPAVHLKIKFQPPKTDGIGDES